MSTRAHVHLSRALLAACALAAPLAAQQPTAPSAGAPAPTGQCDLLVTPNSDSTHFTSTKLPSGEYNNFVGGGVTGHCPAQQITLVERQLLNELQAGGSVGVLVAGLSAEAIEQCHTTLQPDRP